MIYAFVRSKVEYFLRYVDKADKMSAYESNIECCMMVALASLQSRVYFWKQTIPILLQPFSEAFCEHFSYSPNKTDIFDNLKATFPFHLALFFSFSYAVVKYFHQGRDSSTLEDISKILPPIENSLKQMQKQYHYMNPPFSTINLLSFLFFNI